MGYNGPAYIIARKLHELIKTNLYWYFAGLIRVLHLICTCYYWC